VDAIDAQIQGTALVDNDDDLEYIDDRDWEDQVRAEEEEETELSGHAHQGESFEPLSRRM
jgi:hypothetical protein